MKKYIQNVTKTCNLMDQKFTDEIVIDTTMDEKERRQKNKKFMMAHLSFR